MQLTKKSAAAMAARHDERFAMAMAERFYRVAFVVAAFCFYVPISLEKAEWISLNPQATTSESSRIMTRATSSMNFSISFGPA